jgi:hypothetical protein
MTKSLSDILREQHFEEPPEVVIIKQFLADKYQTTCKVSLASNEIVIIVTSAALAGTLRMHLTELKRLCNTDKRLLIRIS